MFTDDQDIERTLKAALNVEAPAGFEDGVRRRLGHEAPARRFAVPVWLAAAAALVILAGGWYLAVRDSRVVEPIDVADNVPASAPAVVPVPPTAPSPALAPEVAAVRPSAPRVTALRPATVAAQVARRAEPEVIVPPNQLEMIERLMRDVHAGRVVLPEAVAQAAEAPPALDVMPVVVDPIAVRSLGPGSVPDPVLKGLQ